MYNCTSAGAKRIRDCVCTCVCVSWDSVAITELYGREDGADAAAAVVNGSTAWYIGFSLLFMSLFHIVDKGPVTQSKNS